MAMSKRKAKGEIWLEGEALVDWILGDKPFPFSWDHAFGWEGVLLAVRFHG